MRKTDHVTLLLLSLGWLPVQYRIYHKILIYVFKALHRMVPEYLAELIKVYNPGLTLTLLNQGTINNSSSMFQMYCGITCLLKKSCFYTAMKVLWLILRQ